MEDLIKQAEEIAQRYTDGHLTIFRFTTGWKVSLGTPKLDIREERDNVSSLKGFSTLEEALLDFLDKKHESFYTIR